MSEESTAPDKNATPAKRGVLIGLLWIVAFLAPPLLVGGIWLYRSLDGLSYVKPPAPLADELPEPPAVDPSKPIVAVLVSNQGTEITDFLAPYAILSASEAFNVVTVAPKRAVSPVWPGLEVFPDFSFDEFDQTFCNGPDFIVVPYFLDYDNPTLLDWLTAKATSEKKVLSICEGARTVAAAGLLDGKTGTTHFMAVSSVERTHTKTQWKRDRRFVTDGNVVSSAGVTAAIDATFEFLRQTVGEDAAQLTAEKLGYEIRNPEVSSPTVTVGDLSMWLLTGAFSWSRTDIGVVVYEGIDEFRLASTLDCFQRTLNSQSISVGLKRQPVKTRHGLTVVPQYRLDEAPDLDRVLAHSASGESNDKWATNRGVEVEQIRSANAGEAYITVLRELAKSENMQLALVVAKLIEFPQAQMNGIDGNGWPILLALRPLLLGVLGIAFVVWIRRCRCSREQK